MKKILSNLNVAIITFAFHLCSIVNFSFDCQAGTAGNDPNGLDLSTIPPEQILYFEMYNINYDPETGSGIGLSHNGTARIFIDEANTCAYIYNLFCQFSSDANKAWVKMAMKKDYDSYTFQLNKFSLQFGNRYTYEYIDIDKVNDYVISVQNGSTDPTDKSINNDLITFNLKNNVLQMVIPDGKVLLNTRDGSSMRTPRFTAFSSIQGTRIYPTFLPDDCELEDWTMTYKRVRYANADNTPEYERSVKVAFDGDDVYLGNLENGTANCWLKGYIKNDKIVFPNYQLYFTSGLCGIIKVPTWRGSGYDLYLNTTNMYITFENPEYYAPGNGNNGEKIIRKDNYEHGKIMTVNPLNEDLIFDYDAENGIISNPSCDFMFDPEKGEAFNDDLYQWTYIKDNINLFSDVYIKKEDTSPVKTITDERKSLSATHQKIYNLQGIRLNEPFNRLPSGIYVVTDEKGSHLIKK